MHAHKIVTHTHVSILSTRVRTHAHHDVPDKKNACSCQWAIVVSCPYWRLKPMPACRDLTSYPGRRRLKKCFSQIPHFLSVIDFNFFLDVLGRTSGKFSFSVFSSLLLHFHQVLNIWSSNEFVRRAQFIQV